MKFFRLDLLTLLISLFILNSCKNQDAIGLGAQTTAQQNGTLVDTSTVAAYTVSEDSVITSGSLGKNPLAFFNDPAFGLTTSDLATDLNLPDQAPYTLPTGTVYIDSVRLILGYADGSYGDLLTSTYTVNVYQLKENFKAGVSYYNTKTWGVTSTLLGTKTFTPSPNDSVKIENIITGAPDTLRKVYPQIRITIDPNFISQNLFNANGVYLGSNAVFTNNIKGLYLTLDRTKTTGQGGIIMLKSTDSIAVYYRSVQGTTIDTTQVYLPITNMAASISHTYPAAIRNAINNSSSQGLVYLQGLAGLRAKISFPNLLSKLRADLAATGNDIVLNRAELVVTASPGTNIPYSPLPKITMYKLDLANQRTLVQDANSTGDPRAQGVGIFGGYYNKTTHDYHFIITAYLQDLLSGKTVDYGTYIAPVDTTNTSSVDIAPTTQVAARTVAIGGNSSSPYKMKLNIIYTKIAKQ